jgi:hypothetical protein
MGKGTLQARSRSAEPGACQISLTTVVFSRPAELIRLGPRASALDRYAIRNEAICRERSTNVSLI